MCKNKINTSVALFFYMIWKYIEKKNKKKTTNNTQFVIFLWSQTNTEQSSIVALRMCLYCLFSMGNFQMLVFINEISIFYYYFFLFSFKNEF